MTGSPGEKHQRLLKDLKAMGRLAVAFSGGADSALLLGAALEALPRDNVLALTAPTEFIPARELAEARELAGTLGAAQVMVEAPVLGLPEVAANQPRRCYYCKKAIFTRLWAEARARGFDTLADGSNLDDDDDYRPGAEALRELGVASPLRAAGLTKGDIRDLSHRLGLATWSKPGSACLASRFPYGHPLAVGELRQVEAAEEYLHGLGFRQVRVRHHGDVARLEIAAKDFPRFTNVITMAEVNEKMLGLGFRFAALDLVPYRQGRMNY